MMAGRFAFKHVLPATTGTRTRGYVAQGMFAILDVGESVDVSARRVRSRLEVHVLHAFVSLRARCRQTRVPVAACPVCTVCCGGTAAVPPARRQWLPVRSVGEG